MKTYFTPFIDVTINALWSDWENYPAGRPNPLYSQQVKDWRVDGLILGFLTLSPSRQACWAAQDTMPLDWATPLAQELKNAGKRVIISFGGAANSDISSVFNVSQLVETYETVINTLNADGLDFDLENGLFDAHKICEAAKNLQSEKPDITLSFTLPVMPSGLTDAGMGIITLAKKAGLNFIINGMAMDYYDPAVDGAMGTAATAAANSIRDQLSTLYPSDSQEALNARIAITPMIGRNDDPSEMFTLADADLLGKFSATNKLSFLSMWSLNRDNPSSADHADSVSSSNPEQTVAGEYSHHFVDALAQAPVIPDDGVSSPSKLIYSDLTSSSLTLSWTPPAMGATAFGIYKNGKLKGRTTSDHWPETQLTAGTEYTYYVTAFDKDDRQSRPSNTLTVTTKQPGQVNAPQWKIATAYFPGDVVTLNGKHYLCLQKHVSIATWAPDVAFSLWKFVS